MAILRGGKRIGGYDIRVGIPRDRSLDNVERDPRLRQKAGGNPETTMGRFQAYVNEAEGFARKARFYTEFFLPRGLSFGGGIGGEDTAVQCKRNWRRFRSHLNCQKNYKQYTLRMVKELEHFVLK